jgi:hypothetical protein
MAAVKAQDGGRIRRRRKGFEDEPWFALLRASGRQEKKSE